MKNISILLIILLAAACGQKRFDWNSTETRTTNSERERLSSLKKEILDLKREIQSLDTNARDNAIAVMAMEVKKDVF